MIVDQVEARADHLHVGSIVKLGKDGASPASSRAASSPACSPISTTLQDEYSQTGKVNVVWVKVDDPANIPAVIAELKDKFDGYNIYSMAEMTSLLTPDNVPVVKGFTKVVIGIAVVVGLPGRLSLHVYRRAGTHPRNRNPESARRIARLHARNSACERQCCSRSRARIAGIVMSYRIAGPHALTSLQPFSPWRS